MDKPRRCSICRDDLTEANANPTVLRKGGYCRPCMADYMRSRQKCLGCGRPTGGSSRCGNCSGVKGLQARSRRCAVCDGMFDGHRNREVCNGCRQASYDDRCSKMRQSRWGEPTQRVCVWCFGEYWSRGVSTTCSDPCKGKLETHYQRWQARDRCIIPQCFDCGTWGGFDPRYSHRCYACQDANLESRRGVAQLRRRQQERAGDSISIAELMVRDKRICHLCGDKVAMPRKAKLKDRHLLPGYPTIDHLVPIADGGTHTWDNVALAHRRCNISRGTSGVVQLRLA